MAKYDPLLHHLISTSEPVLTLRFTEIERIIGADLPPSARRHPAWWANATSSHSYSDAWMDAGYRTEDLDLNAGIITFHRS